MTGAAGVVVSMVTPLKVSGRIGGAQRIAGEVVDRSGDPRHLKRRGVLSGRHRVAEHQRAGAGAADIAGGAAVVERQRRRAGHVHRLAHVERQRQRLAGIVVARGRRHRRYRRRRGVDDDAAEGLRQIGGAQRIAGEVLDRSGDPRHLKRRGVLSGRHRVAEHQRAGAGAADIAGGAAIVEASASACRSR